MSRISIMALAVLAVLVLGACTEQEPEITLEDQVPADQVTDDDAEAPDNDAPAEADGDVVAVEAGDLYFEGIPDTLPAGSVTFELNNVGNLPHDIAIEELGDQVVVHADGGQTETGSVELEAGEYTLYCAVPGHRSQMEETVTVE